MKLVLPLGGDKMVTAAEFNGGAEPQFGCACSNVNGRFLTAEKRVLPPGPYPFDCQCKCAYGSENEAANYELGFNSNEW